MAYDNFLGNSYLLATCHAVVRVTRELSSHRALFVRVTTDLIVTTRLVFRLSTARLVIQLTWAEGYGKVVVSQLWTNHVTFLSSLACEL